MVAPHDASAPAVRHTTALRQLHELDRKARHETMAAAHGIAERADYLEKEARRLGRRLEETRSMLRRMVDAQGDSDHPLVAEARKLLGRTSR